MDNTRVFRMAFASVYPHYIAMAEKRSRTKNEVHAVIQWLTGYDEQALQQQIDKMIARAEVAPKTRRPSRPTFGSKIRRLTAKSKRSSSKRLRRQTNDE